jgi:hypothetical protein
MDGGGSQHQRTKLARAVEGAHAQEGGLRTMMCSGLSQADRRSRRPHTTGSRSAHHVWSSTVSPRPSLNKLLGKNRYLQAREPLVLRAPCLMDLRCAPRHGSTIVSDRCATLKTASFGGDARHGVAVGASPRRRPVRTSRTHRGLTACARWLSGPRLRNHHGRGCDDAGIRLSKAATASPYRAVFALCLLGVTAGRGAAQEPVISNQCGACWSARGGASAGARRRGATTAAACISVRAHQGCQASWQPPRRSG